MTKKRLKLISLSEQLHVMKDAGKWIGAAEAVLSGDVPFFEQKWIIDANKSHFSLIKK